jgi:hypothetical protein
VKKSAGWCDKKCSELFHNLKNYSMGADSEP